VGAGLSLRLILRFAGVCRALLCLSVWQVLCLSAGALLCVSALWCHCVRLSGCRCVPVVRCVWCFMAGFALCGAVGACLGALQVRL
jgi:hypothetical protein